MFGICATIHVQSCRFRNLNLPVLMGCLLVHIKAGYVRAGGERGSETPPASVALGKAGSEGGGHSVRLLRYFFCTVAAR
jgi:hypothetical protein